MAYLSVSEAAAKWGMAERTVRNYCAAGKIPDAFITGKTWNIPDTAEKPARSVRQSAVPATLSEVLKTEKAAGISGGIYHKIQIELTYNSNHMEGSQLSHDQTRYIYETNTVGFSDSPLRVDDIVETANHFRCVDLMIDRAASPLSEALIRKLHAILKNGTSDAELGWFAVGNYKRIPNEVGGRETTPPEQVSAALKKLLAEYQSRTAVTLDDLLDFHVRFE